MTQTFGNNSAAKGQDFSVPVLVGRLVRASKEEVQCLVNVGTQGPSSLLLERGPELEHVSRLLKRARRARGGTLVIEGPAGMGKTALLARVRDLAEADRFRTLRARGAELEREFAFGVVRQLFEPMLAGVGEDERRRLLEGPPGVAARLLGLPGAGDAAGDSARLAPDPSFAVLHGLYWLCVNLTEESPIAMIVDDLHWADAASLRFLAFLQPRLEELSLAMFLASRPGDAIAHRELVTTLSVDITTQVIKVGPLSTSGIAKLLAARLGVEPDPDFVAACEEATGGTPFLVRALIDACREEKRLPDAASVGWVRSGVPRTLGRWAILRLTQLGPEAVALGSAVAIMGETDLASAALLADLSPLEAAQASEVLLQAGVFEESPLRYAHSLLRSGVYREMSVVARSEAHGRAARLLANAGVSAGSVAEHLLATSPARDAWVVEQLQAAAQEAAARGAPKSAVAYLHRALSEPPESNAEAGVLIELGLAEFNADQLGWEVHLQGALLACNDDVTRIAAGTLLANMLGAHERLADAVRVCDEVAAQLEMRDTDAHLVFEATAIENGIFDPSVASDLADRAAALLARARKDALPRSVLAVAAQVAAMANEPSDDVLELAHRAIAAGPRPLPDLTEPSWFGTVANVLDWTGNFEEAQTLLDGVVAEAQASANAVFLQAALTLRAWSALRSSDLIAAEADARAVLDTPGFTSARLWRHFAVGALSESLLEQGKLADAMAEVEGERGAASLSDASLASQMLRYSEGRLLLAQHRPAEALAAFDAVAMLAIQTGIVSPGFLPWRSESALSYLALGDNLAAKQLSEEELTLAFAFGAARPLGIALRAAGIVAGEQDGEVLLREAIDVLDGPNHRLEQARALTDLGALLRRSNRRAEARPFLARALDAAHHIGAALVAHRAETELRATGAKPRRVMLTGLEALTASERRIAELAAEGFTNREIAQTLFVTAGTVEGHLTRVFQKLNVKSRTELTYALSAPTEAIRT